MGSVSRPAIGSGSRAAWGLEQPRLGLALGGAHDEGDLALQRQWALRAEELGLHSVWLPEMHFAPGVCPAPLVELASLASRTTRIRLGTTSLLLPLHSPQALAGQIAALDRISRGRALIGLGRGFQRRMLEAFGVDPASKRGRFDESLDRMLALWADANARGGALATHQRPHPPLAVAAFGPKGLAQAARRGLPYLASPVETLDQIEENQARHRSLSNGSETASLSIVMRTVFVSEDPHLLEQARAALRAEGQRGRARMPLAVRRAIEAPLEQRAIVGHREQVSEALQRECSRLDIDLLIVRPRIARLDPAPLERSLEILAGEIWPDLRDARIADGSASSRPAP